MRYFIKLSYNGSHFHGWQTQPNAVSVQQTVETGLATILRSPIPIVGAGRTDTGVNAACMYAHFDTAYPIPDLKKTVVSLNRLLGEAIAIHEIIPVHESAHARFDAIERTYKYYVSYTKSPFASRFAWHSPTPLDIPSMNQAASILLNTKDFTSFAKLHSDAKTNICDVRCAFWEERDVAWGGSGIAFTISADRFLRNMVRAIVGTLVDVGRGKISIKEFNDIVLKKDRCSAGTSMPGNALFLTNIKYPYLP